MPSRYRVLIPYSSGNHSNQIKFAIVEDNIVLIPYSSGRHSKKYEKYELAI